MRAELKRSCRPGGNRLSSHSALQPLVINKKGDDYNSDNDDDDNDDLFKLLSLSVPFCRLLNYVQPLRLIIGVL